MRLRLISELFAKTTEHQWVSDPRARLADARFALGEYDYRVLLEPHQLGAARYVDVSFYVDQGAGWDESLSGTGNATAVLGMVGHILQEYIAQHRPQLLFFTAAELNRLRVYKALVQRYLTDWFPVRMEQDGGLMLVHRSLAPTPAAAQQYIADLVESLNLPQDYPS